MKRKSYSKMTPAELATATKRFDDEFVADEARPLTQDEQDQWIRVKAKGGRHKIGEGFQRISVSIELGLLKRVTALARNVESVDPNCSRRPSRTSWLETATAAEVEGLNLTTADDVQDGSFSRRASCPSPLAIRTTYRDLTGVGSSSDIDVTFWRRVSWIASMGLARTLLRLPLRNT